MLDRHNHNWHDHKRGASAIGYGLIVGLISVIALASIQSSGGAVQNLFTDVAGVIEAPASGAVAPSPSASASASTSPLPSPTPADLTQACAGALPNNASANITTFTQSWDGSAYQPSSLSYFYDDGIADAECEFACNSGYSYGGGACLAAGNLYVDFASGSPSGPGTIGQPYSTLSSAVAALPGSGGTVSILPDKYPISISTNNLYEVIVIGNADNKTVTIEGNGALLVLSYSGSNSWDGLLGVGGSPNSNVTVNDLHIVQQGEAVFSVLEKGYGNDSGVATSYHQTTGSFVVQNSSFWFEDTPGRHLYTNGNGSMALNNSTIHAPGAINTATYVNYGSGTISNVTRYVPGDAGYLTRDAYITSLGYTP